MVSFWDDDEGKFRVDICAMPGWEDFDRLIDFLKKEYDVEVVSRIDGPDAKGCTLVSDGNEFLLVCDDPYGNEFVAECDASRALIKMIGLDLERRLKELDGKPL
ncbi:hypothetical protein OAU50_04330 [Planctomycetota bacterium]|nr:hypothetical protein [Planctomycetota bacterium]